MIDPGSLHNKAQRIVRIPAGRVSEQEAWIRGHVTDKAELSAVVHKWLVAARPYLDSAKDDPEMPALEVVL